MGPRALGGIPRRADAGAGGPLCVVQLAVSAATGRGRRGGAPRGRGEGCLARVSAAPRLCVASFVWFCCVFGCFCVVMRGLVVWGA